MLDTDVVDPSKPEWWKEFHERLGCYGCKWADRERLGKGACCTQKGGGNSSGKGGKCLSREEE